jgi:enoyl-CoA hydratase
MAERAFVKVAHEGPISIVTIDRQDKLNALNADVVRELGEAVAEVRARSATRCAIVTGAGEKAFVAGADIAGMRELGLEQARAFAKAGHAALDAIEALPFPAIAAVNGFALGGGCELALACDFVYASERAKLGQPEVKLGVIPGFGGTQRLARRVGIARARELVYTGATIDAQEALRIGLVSRVVPPADLMKVAREAAGTIAQMGPLAIAEAKKVLRDGEGRLLRDANALEIEGFAGCFETADQKEGMAAFLEKRPARFSGE